jgi:hypothetical protein
MKTKEEVLEEVLFGTLGIGFVLFILLATISGISLFVFGNRAAESVFTASLVIILLGSLGLVWSPRFREVVARAVPRFA